MTAAKIAEILKEKSNFAITFHVMPDGDSVGSSLALYNVLKRSNKNVDVFSSDKVPDVFSYLPGYDSIKDCSLIGKNAYDALIIIDSGDYERIGKCADIKANITVNIDHHATNDLYADINFVDMNSAAAGELIYQIIKLMEPEIQKDEAACLYTAILTDTGGFRYSNTTPLTHLIAGKLISTGIAFSGIHDIIYRNFEYDSIKLLGKVLESIELHCRGRIAFMKLLKSDIGNIDISNISTTDFINYGRDIKSVECAAFIKETGAGEFKVSLRSKNYVDVKSVCEKFGGGGHIRAAGCTIKGNFENAKKSILDELAKALKE